MINDATVAVDLLVPFIRALREAGPRVEHAAIETGRKLLAEVGLRLRDLADPNLRLPHSVGVRLIDETTRVTGNPCFALSAGLSAKPGEWGILECLISFAETLRQSIYATIHYLPLMHDGAEVQYIEEGDFLYWRHRLANDLINSTASNEYVVAVCLTNIQRLLGSQDPPVEIHFLHKAPPHANECSKLLRTRVRFNCEYNAIIIPKTALDLPLIYSNSGFYTVLERYANELLSGLPIRYPYTRRVSKIVRERLSSRPTQLEVARVLKLNERSLRRRLSSEGTSHQKIIDRVRREVAIELMADKDINIAEIAFQLGFSHSSAFHRAFTRWYGVSPTDYRKKRVPSAFYRLSVCGTKRNRLHEE